MFLYANLIHHVKQTTDGIVGISKPYTQDLWKFHVKC